MSRAFLQDYKNYSVDTLNILIRQYSSVLKAESRWYKQSEAVALLNSNRDLIDPVVSK